VIPVAKTRPDERNEMPSTTHVLDEARDLVKKRLAELDDERKRLERALAELGGKVTGRPGRRPGRPRGSGTKKAAGPPRRRRKGTRADQAVALVEGKPGISASEIAKTMKIKPNYLYRVLGDMEKEGRVTKKGRQYFPSK
jgi:DNA invertase Pin-like site-specific DNA recombinase